MSLKRSRTRQSREQFPIRSPGRANQSRFLPRSISSAFPLFAPCSTRFDSQLGCVCARGAEFAAKELPVRTPPRLVVCAIMRHREWVAAKGAFRRRIEAWISVHWKSSSEHRNGSASQETSLQAVSRSYQIPDLDRIVRSSNVALVSNQLTSNRFL